MGESSSRRAEQRPGSVGGGPDRRDTLLNTDLVAESVDEDRAVVRGRSRYAKERSRTLRPRAEAAQDEARRAIDLAVSALAEVDGLRRAMQTRSNIDMAKGILIERFKVDPQRAFELLVETSQKSHTKVVEIAEALVNASVAKADTDRKENGR